MTTTQLANVYEPTTFNQLMGENPIELNAFLQSGVMVEYPLLTSMANVGGLTGELPFYKPLDAGTEANHTNDDPSDTSTPNLHLVKGSAAIGVGTNLTNDVYLPFTTDIDGETRPDTGDWDVGADHYIKYKRRIITTQYI